MTIPAWNKFLLSFHNLHFTTVAVLHDVAIIFVNQVHELANRGQMKRQKIQKNESLRQSYSGKS